MKQEYTENPIKWNFPSDVAPIWNYVQDEEITVNGELSSLPEFEEEGTESSTKLEPLADFKIEFT